ncbi:hypothetical protein [Ferruginibacter sp. HRS2-29]|uniref:hypothetical protein n=1 Tax=Ferruginibacter sp. HRS2-29 TaxID=2487334 RepID=UPI0020CF609F|nr:hypothetical protein [Ferruginibacter sp. HRS2-29]MCP9750912.1 hypothetical protein [Ferruginibacter sp. HRS2-29]
MQKLFYLILLISCLSCHHSGRDADNISKKTSKHQQLLLKFKSISFDTLRVFSFPEKYGEFQGELLDSADVALFAQENYGYDAFGQDSAVFAIYKFPVDSNRIGLIVRTPSEFESSSIKFFILDKEKDKLLFNIELAEKWADAGDFMSKDAWIFKDSTHKLKTLLWVYEAHDNSVNDQKDTTVQQWDHLYLINLSGRNADTVSKDKALLKWQFKGKIEPYWGD